MTEGRTRLPVGALLAGDAIRVFLYQFPTLTVWVQAEVEEKDIVDRMAVVRALNHGHGPVS